MESTIYIKNMVCPRCIDTVKDILGQVSVEAKSVTLGAVILGSELTSQQKQQLEEKLAGKGFGLLQDAKSRLIGQIKAIIVDQVHYQKTIPNINFSDLLSEKLHHDYASLSRLFSSVEGMTIERFIVKQKIEKVKELLFYDELSLSEIADKMDYSSVAHLSARFKKETGMTATAFKKLRRPGHQPLDTI